MRTWSLCILGVVLGHTLAANLCALQWQVTTIAVTTAPFQASQDVTFAFTNAGTKPVTLRDLETNCDCLEASADQKIYLPGAHGLIRARFTVGDRTGLYERVVTVVTDEPESPVRLHVQIEVPPVATLSPVSLDWPLLGATAEKIIELQPAAGLEINFTTAIATHAAFATRLETVTPGRHYRLYVTPRETKQAANAAIRISGRDKDGHEVVVSAYANVR